MSSKYHLSSNLSASGHRSNKENEKLILLHLTEQSSCFRSICDGWDYYLAIDPAKNEYNSELRAEQMTTKGIGKAKYTIELTNQIIEDVMRLAADDKFMGAKHRDINGEFYVLDGVETTIEIKVAGKRMKVEDNTFFSITENGTFSLRGEEYSTKLHLIFKRIYAALEKHNPFAEHHRQQ